MKFPLPLRERARVRGVSSAVVGEGFIPSPENPGRIYFVPENQLGK